MFQSFDRITVISLRARTDRRAETAAELQRHGVLLHRITWHIADKPTATPPNWSRYTLGTYGCYTSHLQVLKNFLASTATRMLVLEDDVHLTRSDVTVPDHSMVYFGALRRQIHHIGWETLADNDGIVGLHCYGVTRAAAAILVSDLEAAMVRQDGDPLGGPCHVDGAISMIRERHGIPTALLGPAIALQRSSATDIHPLAWYDRAPIVRSLVARLRAARNRIHDHL